MTSYVPRTCSEITGRDVQRTSDLDSRPLEAYRLRSAYVLLGDPGAGKTTEFQNEEVAIDDGHYVTARNFITLNPSNHPEWHSRTLFIDGLDEIRAGTSDSRAPFDKICSRLESLGNPRFRLSCRAADWLGSNDLDNLKSVSPDGNVAELRLDPLTDSDVHNILRYRLGHENALAYFRKAMEFGIEGLLDNPQSLVLLVAAVGDGRDWPQSRLELFENACQALSHEHNDEHVIPDGHPYNPDLLLDAAGRLCALVLISGAVGFAGDPRHVDADFPYLDYGEYGYPEYLKAARTTKLFTESNGRFASIHRHVAEYLAARHLGRTIDDGAEPGGDNGLPARRAIALMAGKDGSVVSELRGVSGWLAACCPKARRDLISRDPVGVGLYGDIRGFTPEEKRTVLFCIKSEVSKLEDVYYTAPAFAPLATPDLESEIRKLLEDPSRDQKHHRFVNFLLCALAEGTPMPGFSDLLIEIVRDPTRPQGVKSSALFAFLRICSEYHEKTVELHRLLEEIVAGTLQDHSNELRGAILSQFYPIAIPPTEIWNHLIESGHRVGGNAYDCFWRDELIDQSSDDQIAQLLDSLESKLPGLYPAIKYHFAGDTVLSLLLRGLEIHGETIDVSRLYDWLGVGCPDYSIVLPSIENTESDIRSWLERHPGLCRMILLEGLRRGPDTNEFWNHSYEVVRRTYDASMPTDHGLWCLKQAAVVSATNPKTAEFLWEEAILAYKHNRNNDGLSLELLKKHARLNETFRARLDIMLNPKPDRALMVEKSKEEVIEKSARRKNQWIEHIRSNEAALRENRALPDLLYRLAGIYFGQFINYQTGDGLKALVNELDSDEDLVVSVQMGFFCTVEREDLPTAEDILDLYESKRVYSLGLPFLAGLEERQRKLPGVEFRLDDRKARTALAFYFTTIHGDYRPAWFDRLLTDNPAVVAEVLEKYSVSRFRYHRDSVSEAYDLAYDPSFKEVARVVTLPLLSRFPTRCNGIQLDTLENMIRAAIWNADPMLLRHEIDQKLQLSSMDVAQRARWLAAALAVSPGKYNDSVVRFVGAGRGRERRIHALISLFFPRAFSHSYVRGLRIPEIKLLIRIIGCITGPALMYGGIPFDENKNEEGGYVTNEMHTAYAVLNMIEALARDPCPEATDALTDLTGEDTLSDWHGILESNLHRQQKLRRDASFQHPSVEEICHTLTDAQPSNAADLSALVLDRLREIAMRIRDGNTDDWKQYWNVDSHGRPTEVRPEESCRDALLSDLQQNLPNGVVAAEPEGHYADDNRADMRITFFDFHVPVEVKKNNHHELWSAIRNQLIRKYTREPTTSGYGIYVIFWFGKEITQAPPDGKRPETPSELAERLERTLSEEEVRKISVCVIDVSKDQSSRS